MKSELAVELSATVPDYWRNPDKEGAGSNVFNGW